MVDEELKSAWGRLGGAVARRLSVRRATVARRCGSTGARKCRVLMTWIADHMSADVYDRSDAKKCSVLGCSCAHDRIRRFHTSNVTSRLNVTVLRTELTRAPKRPIERGFCTNILNKYVYYKY